MKYNVIDLFAGCGGLTDGFLQTGAFSTLAAIDWELPTINTLRNRLNTKYKYPNKILNDKVLYFDIQRTDELLNGYSDEKYGSNEGLIKIVNNQKVDLIIGGPPCQAYSIAGRVRSENGMKDDYRNFLFESYVKVVSVFKPSFFIFENVEGILSAKPGNVSIIKRIYQDFKKIGYIIPENLKEIALFDLSNFGVPQKRKRVIIFGVRQDLGINKITEFYNNLANKKNNTVATVDSAILDLPKLIPLKSTQSRQSHKSIEGHSFKNHEPRYHSSRDIEIFKILTKDIENKTFKYSTIDSLIDLYEQYTGKKSNFHKYNVIKLNAPSNTIPAHLYKDGLRHIHPDSRQARSITVREAARIQSFDDDFEFLGSRGDQYKMVGNAVPPLFAKQIAEAILPLFN